MVIGPYLTTIARKVRNLPGTDESNLIVFFVDIEAAQHALDVSIGQSVWILDHGPLFTSFRLVCGTYLFSVETATSKLYQDPIYLGHYPEYMKEMLGNRLPEFTLEELAVIEGSSDFYGMNTYTTNLCSVSPSTRPDLSLIFRSEAGGDDEFQGCAEYTFTRPDGTQLGTQGFAAVHCNHRR